MAASIPLFPFDPALAENLGFLYLAVGGSRVYQQRDQKSLHKTAAKVQDWDLVGLVESKGDILCLVLRKETQLRSLLGIVNAEYLTWEVLREGKNQENWEVLRFAGTAKDGSKRSLKICSRDHLLHVGSEPAIRRFGVLSSRKVRYTRRYHPRDGHRIFIYQPLKLTEDLFVLDDADFLHPKDDLIAVNPGVTCDLFLTSVPVYEVAHHTASSLKATLLHKWRAISKEPCVKDVIPLLYRFRDFDAQFAQRLRIEFTRVAGASPRPLVNLSSPSRTEMKESEIRRRQRLQKQYHILCILDIAWDFWSPRYILSSPTPAALDNHEETFEFRAAAERYRPSPFTSNSEGLFGEICFRTDAEWRRVYVKKASHVIDELRALPDVLRYFPPSCVQQLLAADKSASQLFFRRFEGKMLSKVRLEYYDNKSFLNHTGPMDAVDWFVEIEMQRTEHVGDAYRSTMNMDPIPARCAEQHIHRFYYARLESDSRFLEFYSEQCLDVLGIYDLKEVGTSDFLNMPLTINGTSYPPLRYYLDRAKDVLDPSAPGGLSSLSEAFGLGDGHGGNVMVTEDYASPKMIYLDYEVSGFHCPFLDMAKSIYNDGFFNVLYADLLCDDATDRQNKSGAVVSWVINSEALCIDYSVRVDAIGKTTAITKLEYLLRPIFNLVRRQSLRKAKVAEDVLSNSLFACALLSRNFAKRADIFFLNLALGVRLVDNLREVLSEVFGWRGLPVVGLSIRDMKIEEPPVRELSVALYESRGHACSDVFLLYNLKPEEVFLKRASETFQLQHRFSRKSDESHGTVLHRISDARYTGMKIAPHTCIRESLFAEPRIDHHFAYSTILKSRRPESLLIDVGCCMGTDIRKLILDGYPPECILGLDVEKRFFKLGHDLYNEDEESSRLRFRQADMLDPRFTERTSDLQNRFHFVHTANVIHLFNLRDQETFFRNLVHLTKPGGIIWGRQVGLAENTNQSIYKQPEGKGARFTIKEFRDFLLGITGWTSADMQFEAQLVEYDELRVPRVDKNWVLQWSIHIPAGKLARDRSLSVVEV